MLAGFPFFALSRFPYIQQQPKLPSIHRKRLSDSIIGIYRVFLDRSGRGGNADATFNGRCHIDLDCRTQTDTNPAQPTHRHHPFDATAL